VFPLLIVTRELDSCEMALDGRHGDIAMAPWRAKVKVESVIFNVLVAGVALWRVISTGSCHVQQHWAHSLILSTRKMGCNSLGDGGLLGHTENTRHGGFGFGCWRCCGSRGQESDLQSKTGGLFDRFVVCTPTKVQDGNASNSHRGCNGGRRSYLMDRAVKERMKCCRASPTMDLARCEPMIGLKWLMEGFCNVSVFGNPESPSRRPFSVP
jgi:hypothetical protein